MKKKFTFILIALCLTAFSFNFADAKTRKTSRKAKAKTTKVVNSWLVGNVECFEMGGIELSLKGNKGKISYYNYDLTVISKTNDRLILLVKDTYGDEIGRMEGSYSSYRGRITSYDGTYIDNDGDECSFEFLYIDD